MSLVVRTALEHLNLIGSDWLRSLPISAARTKRLISGSNVGFCLRRTSTRFCALGEDFVKNRLFCTSVHCQGLSWGASSNEVLLKKLESALKDHKVDEAWERFKDFNGLYGLPNHYVVNRFITELSYSSKLHWLQKACDLARSIFEQKPDWLHQDVLTKLSLSLARAMMPEPASMILRLMLEKDSLPSVDVLRMVLLHMVKSETGASLASNFLVQLCDRYVCLPYEKTKCSNILVPDTLIFNLVLDGCVKFGLYLRGQDLVELMARSGVVADAHSIVAISCIHEMNGQHDELKKYKEHIDRALGCNVTHYKQFYDSLLSLHFRFDDIDSAGELVYDMCKNRESPSGQRNIVDPHKPRLVPLGSHHIRFGLKLQIAPEVLQKDSLLGAEHETSLFIIRDNRLVPTNMAMAKLICGYKRHGKISKLSNLLLVIQKEIHSSETMSLPFDVIDACIHLGWLEIAHDILDDMESAGNPMSFVAYKTLLMGYHKARMSRNVEALLRQMKKAGVIMVPSVEEVDSLCSSETERKSTQSDLVKCLIQEINEENKTTRSIDELNSSLYYFCKARMMGDTLSTYRRMQQMRIKPSVQTFAYMITMYSSLQMYREITFLWGDIKRNLESGKLIANGELFELLVMNFLKGGYFERVMEVIAYMNQHDVFADKLMYKSEFLKHHKNLYRRLKASNARTEAQGKRLEHVRTFRRWVGID